MEVTFIAAVCIHLHSILHVSLHLQVLVDYEYASRLYQSGVVAEAFEISLFGAVYVEVVRVGRGDHAHPRTEPMEAAVELVGLYHHVVALFAEDIVCAVVL